VSTVLFHTANGGISWNEEPGSTTGSNGGTQVVGFANANDGWRQQFATGSNAAYLLETTNNGGTTWRAFPQTASNGGCEFAQDVFANTNDGFGGAMLDISGTDLAEGVATPQAWVWRTSNGGETWHQMTTAPPSGLANAAAFYDLPAFFNMSDGVMPVQYSEAAASKLAFYTSSDAGLSWRLSASVPDVSTAQYTENAGTCGTRMVGKLPMISLASMTTWWAIDASDSSVSITTNGGRSWTNMPVTNLGFMHRNGNVVQSFSALNSTIAWVSTVNETTGTQLWQTTDGGQTWAQVTATSLQAAVTATSLPSCANAQLSVSPGRSGAGLGHNGEALLFTNVSHSGCTLYGYPGVAALDGQGNQIAQAARTPNGYLGGITPSSNLIPLVPLSPGHSASALVEGTDNPLGPGPNPPPCPVDSGLLVTAPNTTRSVRLPPGPALCSGLQIHPVVPGITGSDGD
jgi:hypothetical protein